MKANELRIWNWVYSPSHKSNYKIIKLDFDSEINAEPIPLTEEWLVNFGFEKIAGYYMMNEFTFNDGTFLWNDFCISTSTIHVHQLQNLFFALTNEELTFKK